jgi:hypothetical protein
VDRKKSVNDEKSPYINNNRPRLDVFRKLTCPEMKSTCNDDKYTKSNSQEIYKAFSDLKNNNNLENNLNNKCLRNIIKIENKSLEFEDFCFDDNFKRLKSDLIPRDNYFESYKQDQEDEDFFKKRIQNINNQQNRKHSFLNDKCDD